MADRVELDGDRFGEFDDGLVAKKPRIDPRIEYFSNELLRGWTCYFNSVTKDLKDWKGVTAQAETKSVAELFSNEIFLRWLKSFSISEDDFKGGANRDLLNSYDAAFEEFTKAIGRFRLDCPQVIVLLFKAECRAVAAAIMRLKEQLQKNGIVAESLVEDHGLVREYPGVRPFDETSFEHRLAAIGMDFKKMVELLENHGMESHRQLLAVYRDLVAEYGRLYHRCCDQLREDLDMMEVRRVGAQPFAGCRVFAADGTAVRSADKLHLDYHSESDRLGVWGVFN